MASRLRPVRPSTPIRWISARVQVAQPTRLLNYSALLRMGMITMGRKLKHRARVHAKTENASINLVVRCTHDELRCGQALAGRIIGSVHLTYKIRWWVHMGPPVQYLPLLKGYRSVLVSRCRITHTSIRECLVLSRRCETNWTKYRRGA